MNKFVKEDLYRYEGPHGTGLLKLWRYIIFTPGFRYVYLYRKASTSKWRITKLFWEINLRLCSWQTAIQIPSTTQIGRGFRIVHFGHIVVNPGAKIGNNFNVSQGVLIGSSEGKMAGVPTIGDNVCINANAIVVGRAKIGNNVLIAPGAFVNFDVPDNSIVIGNPGKIIPKDRPTDKFIVYPLPIGPNE